MLLFVFFTSFFVFRAKTMPIDRQISGKQKKYYSAKKKLEIIQKKEQNNWTNYECAKAFGLQAHQVKKWEQNKSKLIHVSRKGKKGFILQRTKMNPQHHAIEEELYEYVQRLRSNDICVSTSLLCQKAKQIDSTFHGGEMSKLKWWCYQFLKRYDLSIRKSTRQGQKLSGHLQAEQKDFVASITERFQPDGTLAGLPPNLLINMDETPVYFEPVSNTTIHNKGENTVSIRCSGQSTRCTAVLAVAADGTKLPPMIIFKAKPGATIEKSLGNILPNGCFGSCETKAFMNTRSMNIWINSVLKPYIEHKPAACVLLDDYNPHKIPSVTKRIESLGADVNILPGGYTCVLQPLDVGINKPFKHLIKEYYNSWAVDNLEHADKVPVPDRKLISKWICDAWDQISSDTIVDTFKRIGYIH
jgi:hypothetical protein